jgi:hypothetical protein
MLNLGVRLVFNIRNYLYLALEVGSYVLVASMVQSSILQDHILKDIHGVSDTDSDNKNV